MGRGFRAWSRSSPQGRLCNSRPRYRTSARWSGGASSCRSPCNRASRMTWSTWRWTGRAFTCASSPFTACEVRNRPPALSRTIRLASFRLRRFARFRYVDDMGCWWAHELRVAKRPTADLGKRCAGRAGSARTCPTEDCGGHDASHTRRDEAPEHAAEIIRNQHLEHVHLSNGVCARARALRASSAASA